MNDDALITKATLLGSLLLFTQVFYKIRTGREFIISKPVSNESHFITICKGFTRIFNLETKRLMINCPPGWGKSELCKHFVAWALAHYPDCQFLYISSGHTLAESHTLGIRQIIELPAYRKIFGVEISQDSSAKDNFKTTAGGAVKAFGIKGGVTGHDAGLPGLDRFSGAVIIDDIHKLHEVHSDTIRDSIWANYQQILEQRVRGVNVPIFFIGQRTHEDDVPARLLAGKDGRKWDNVILKAVDQNGNVLYPEKDSAEEMRIKREFSPYVYASQYQQDPIPAGGGLFKEDDFVLLEEEPDILTTFITADTAETVETYNDYTVFSFWGLYKIKQFMVETDIYGLHWIDCLQIRVEPKDLKGEFLQFYANAMRHKVKPRLAAIEKKSTGVTLLSIMSDMQGLRVIDIPRGMLGSKANRFIVTQPYVCSKRISLDRRAKHVNQCLEHCKKITANNTHAFDDIADTLADAVRVALIDGSLDFVVDSSKKTDAVVKNMADYFTNIQKAREQALWRP